MALKIENYSDIALEEIETLLRDRVRKYGECMISSKTIRTTLERRFGLMGRGRHLKEHVQNILIEKGFLIPWQNHYRSESLHIIFQLNTELLN